MYACWRYLILQLCSLLHVVLKSLADLGARRPPSTPTLPYIDWSGIEAYVNGSATGENYNAVDEGDDAEVKSSFTIVNPTNSSTTYSYKTYVNGQLYSSINTTTLGANTSVTIPQSFSSSNMQSDYVVSIRVRIDDGTVARGWTFDIDGMVMPPL